MRFDQFELLPAILKNIASEGYETATPIQAGAIPLVLEGRDVLGCAQTGTGKTAAFALPIIHRLMSGVGKKQEENAENGETTKKKKSNKQGKKARSLVLCPTRELATQISDAFRTYAAGSGLRGVVIYGGVNQNPQVNKLRSGVDVIIATPGRLLDLMEQGHVDLSNIKTLVLDEADRMLDMGFIPDIRRIVGEMPNSEKGRQTLLFSATLPPAIIGMTRQMMSNPEKVEIAAEMPTADLVKQSVYFVDTKSKTDLLADLIESEGMFRTIVFTRTKHGADKLVKKLRLRNIKSEAIHGNKTQNARQRALDNFRGDKVSVLVATDVAARGIDVDNISHVVNFDLTHEPETYVHRIGRTARAGAEGVAISFCDGEEVGWLRDIERLLGSKIEVQGETPAWANKTPKSSARRGGYGGKRGGGGGGGQRRSFGGGGGGGGHKKSARRGGPQGNRGGTQRRASK